MQSIARLVLFFLLAGSAIAQASADRSTEVRRYLEAQHAKHGFPGMCASWVLPNGTLESVAVGMADREAGRAMTVRDRLLSGSIGKTYVATVILQLVAEGKVSLGDLAAKYLGGGAWFEKLPNAKTLTVRSLLNHTSGIPRYVFEPAFQKVVRTSRDKVWKPEELLAFVFGKQPAFAVGEGWAYADTNYVVLGLIIEAVTGRTYYEELHRRVIHRFDLKDTIPSDRRCLPGLTQGYSGMGQAFGIGDRSLVGGVFAINPQFEWCGGGLYSTTADLARWARRFGAAESLPEKLRMEMRQGVAAPMLGRNAKYGLGTILLTTKHGPTVGHSGFMPGYRSEMRYYLNRQLAVAIQFNTDIPRQIGQAPGTYFDAIVERVAREVDGGK